MPLVVSRRLALSPLPRWVVLVFICWVGVPVVVGKGRLSFAIV